MSTATAHVKRPFKGGGAFKERKERNLANRALESEEKSIHQATDPQSFHNMSPATGTAHAKRPFVGGGAFTERLLANKALESERKLRELMGMLLEAVLSGPFEKEEVSSARELESGDDDEWEDVEDDDEDDDEDDWEDVHDEDVWEYVDDDEDCEAVEDVDDNSPGDCLDFSDSSHSPHSSSNPSLFLSPFLSNNPPTKDYPPIGHLSFATIEEARTAYYSTLSQVENLLVKWYHKDDVTALVKTLIESAQASYAEQEEFWKDRRIVQDWFAGIDK